MNAMIRIACYGSAALLLISSVAQAVASHQPFDSHSYEYDDVSNIVERTSGGVTTEFGYDLVGQLISETRNGYAASYTYDANGNRLTRTVNSVTEDYVYDSADKLLEVSIDSQVVKEFTYDSAGRTTSVTTSAGTTTLSWDYEDRLTGITYPNTSTNSFAYNAFGARVSKTDSGGSFTFSRAGASSGAAILSDGSASYTPGISERRSGVSRFYHFGAQGENGRETASNESTASARTWDAWGNPLSYTGSTNSPFGFLGGVGGEFEFDSSLIFIGRSTYDPSTGRTLAPPERGGRSGAGNNWGGPGGHAPASVSFGPQIAELDIPFLDGKPAVGYDATPWWQKGLDGAYDVAVGWGDGASLGATWQWRQANGYNDVVDTDSIGYRVGVCVGVANHAAIMGLPRPLPAAPTVVLGPGGKPAQYAAAHGGYVFKSKLLGKIEAWRIPKSAVTKELVWLENMVWLGWKMFAGYRIRLLEGTGGLFLPREKLMIRFLQYPTI